MLDLMAKIGDGTSNMMFRRVGIVGAIPSKGEKRFFVTTSKLKKQAIASAKGQHIIFIDGEKFAYNVIEYNFGVSTKKDFYN